MDTYSGEDAEKAILDYWKAEFDKIVTSLSDKNSDFKKKINELDTKLEAEKGKHWLDFPGWGKIPPAEVLIFQPSLTGASFSLTGIDMSVTAISLGFTFYKIRNGIFGCEPAIVDNSNCLECSELLGSGMAAKLLADLKIVQRQIKSLQTIESELQEKKKNLMEKHG